MHKSVLRERLGTTATPGPGEALVASGVWHPARGYVRSPAALVVADHLRSLGLTVRLGEVSASGGEPGVGELHMVSYLDRDGGAVGFGAVVYARDAAGRRAVDEVLTAWSATLRTRRIVTAATPPWCAGGAGALETAERLLARSGGPVYLYGRLSDNPVVMRRLRSRGLMPVDELYAVPDGATVLFAQHGVALAVAAEAAARGLRVVDATCPLVGAAHAEVRRFTDRGDTVVLVGRAPDAAVPGLVGQAPESVRLAGSVRDVASTKVADPERVAVVLQPGLPAERTAPVVDALRARFGRVAPQHPATICDAADDRQVAVRALAETCDTVLIARGEDGADDGDDAEVERLAALLSAAGAEHGGGYGGGRLTVHAVTRLADLRPEWIAPSAAVGITATVRADPALAGRLAATLTGLGPSSVVDRHVATEPVVVASPAARISPRPARRVAG